MGAEPGTLALKLRADAYFVAEADGVRLWNDHGSYLVKGKSAYELIRTLFRALDGTRTAEQICAGLDDRRRRAVEQQLAVLVERRFVKEVVLPREPVPAWAARSHADVLEFLDQYDGDPVARLLAFRRRRVVCVGSGLLLHNMVGMLIEHGAGRLQVIDLDPADGALAAIAAAGRRRDPELELIAGGPTAPGGAAGAHAEVVIAAGDSFAPEELARLCAGALAAGATFSAVSPAADSILAVPLVTAASSICWECAYRAVFGAGGPDARLQMSPLAAALGCHHVVHVLFGHVTGIRPADLDQVATVDPASATSRLRRVARHPACPAHAAGAARPWTDDGGAPARPDLPTSTDPEAITDGQNAIAEHTARWTDAIVGPILVLGEHDVVQVPLSATRCRMRTLRSRPDQPEAHDLICRGPSARETRNQLVLLALEHLAREAAESAPALAALDHGHRGRRPAIGAGWSPDEARFRAVYRATIDAAGPAPGPGAELAPPSVRDDAVGAWLLEVVTNGGMRPAPVTTIERAPTGLVLARATIEAGGAGLGAGATPAQAVVNALMDLACDLDRAGAPGRVEPVILTAGAATWRELIAAEAAASRSWWDVGELVPFCRGVVWLALLDGGGAG